MTLSRAALAGLLSAPLLTGCGGSGPPAAPVKGKIVSAVGGPFRGAYPADPALPPGDPGVRVKFVALTDPPETFAAVVDPDTGTFTVPGPAGRGVPAGKYRAVVYVGAAGAATAEPPPAPRRPPTAEDPGDDDTGLDGREVARTEVTVPPEGLTDLTIPVKAAKPARGR